MSRQRYQMTLHVDSPLLVGNTQSAGNYRQTNTVIPGKTWRGALAEVLRQTRQALFKELFERPEDEQIYFGSMLPTTDAALSSPPPTRFGCKRKSSHRLFDTLTRQYSLEAAPLNSLPVVFDQMRCPECGGSTESNTDIVAGDDVVTLATTHTAINRVRRVAQDGLLYTQEGVFVKTAGIAYTGWMDIPTELIPALENSITEGMMLRIGGSRSRGMGRVSVESFEPLHIHDTLQQRISHFNRALYTCLSLYQGLMPINEALLNAARQNRFFTLNLRDEAIFLSHSLPSADPVLPAAMEIVSRWIRWHDVGGWHQAARLPRRTHKSVSGVYLCRFQEGAAVDFEALNTLEQEGIGAGRGQGYGQILVCDPVHYLHIGLEG